MRARSEDRSASSTARITKKCWWFASIPEVLANEKLPPPLVTKHIWQERFEDINNFEQHLTRNGIAVVKFFLHLSKKEQKRRFMERLDTPDKNWKFSAADVKERECWDAYQEAYRRYDPSHRE